MKYLKFFLFFVYGLLLAFAVNFTFSFRDEILTFEISFLLFILTGLLFSFKTGQRIAFLAAPIIYFFMINVFIYYWPSDIYLVLFSVLMHFIGYGIRTLFLRKKYWVGITALLFTFLAVFYILNYPFLSFVSSKNMKEVSGITLPEKILFTTIKGDTIKKADLLGKIVVLETWHSRCGLCKQQFQEMNQIQKLYPDTSKVLVIALDNGTIDSLGAFKNYVEKHPEFNFVFAYDNNGIFSKEFNLKSSPHTFVIDKNGRIIFRIHGYGNITKKVFVQTVKSKIEDIIVSE